MAKFTQMLIPWFYNGRKLKLWYNIDQTWNKLYSPYEISWAKIRRMQQILEENKAHIGKWALEV